MADVTRFPIRFDAPYALLSRALFLPPSAADVALVGDDIEVRMGWAFRARFPRACVASVASRGERFALTRGAHGFGGRWLVNGAGDGIVTIDLEPAQRAYVVGVPVTLRQLLVSIEDPGALVAALSA